MIFLIPFKQNLIKKQFMKIQRDPECNLSKITASGDAILVDVKWQTGLVFEFKIVFKSFFSIELYLNWR